MADLGIARLDASVSEAEARIASDERFATIRGRLLEHVADCRRSLRK